MPGGGQEGRVGGKREGEREERERDRKLNCSFESRLTSQTLHSFGLNTPTFYL